MQQATPTATVGTTGSRQEFEGSWKSRREAQYNHWTSGIPRNQIQLAFRRHWHLFRSIIGDRQPGTCLEVGCGRGSISSYFAQHGWKCTLLDFSESVLPVARRVFETNGHTANYIRGDAMQMPVDSESVDVVVSIGLLEHFEEPEVVLAEQARVLAPGGVLLVYVVPEYHDNVQRGYLWINACLRAAAKLFAPKSGVVPKQDLYRSDDPSPGYVRILKELGLQDIEAMGVYPLPMISHSPEFPFSLLPKPLEFVLTRIFASALAVRRALFRRDPWICGEGFGQAFLLVARRPPVTAHL